MSKIIVICEQSSFFNMTINNIKIQNDDCMWLQLLLCRCLVLLALQLWEHLSEWPINTECNGQPSPAHYTEQPTHTHTPHTDVSQSCLWVQQYCRWSSILKSNIFGYSMKLFAVEVWSDAFTAAMMLVFAKMVAKPCRMSCKTTAVFCSHVVRKSSATWLVLSNVHYPFSAVIYGAFWLEFSEATTASGQFCCLKRENLKNAGLHTTCVGSQVRERWSFESLDSSRNCASFCMWLDRTLTCCPILRKSYPEARKKKSLDGLYIK